MRRSFFFLVNFVPIYMPALSPSMDSGVIVEWKKKIGDFVMENDVFCTVQTDKAVVDYTNTFDPGYLAKICHQNGETVSVAKTIAVMVEEAADVPKAADYCPDDASTAAATAPTPKPTPVTPTPVAVTASAPPVQKRYGGSLDEAIEASGPSVIRIASGLDRSTIESIAPTGKGGRFSKSDFIGQPGFLYEDEPPAKRATEVKSSAAAAGKATAGVVIQAFPVYNFKVSDTKILRQLLRTMPVPKPKAKAGEGSKGR